MVESGPGRTRVASLTGCSRLWKTFAPAEMACLALTAMRAREEAAELAAAIEVDFAELTRLAVTMRALAGELSQNGALCVHLNDPDLAGAFHQVERNWHKQRVTLQTFLDSAAGSIASSLAGYRQLETELERVASFSG